MASAETQTPPATSPRITPRFPHVVDFGRETCGHLWMAERREWLVTNGINSREVVRSLMGAGVLRNKEVRKNLSYGTNLRSGHELQNLPAILSDGGAPGIKHGRHIILPKEDTPLANYWLTLMQQAGVETESFSHSTGIVPELLA